MFNFNLLFSTVFHRTLIITSVAILAVLLLDLAGFSHC